MSTYKFQYTPDFPEQATVTVEFDDCNGAFPFIAHVIEAFEQFLLGVTYQPGSIARCINKDYVRQQLSQYAAAQPK